MSRMTRAVFCDAAVQTWGKENLIGVFDRFTVPGLPVLCPPFVFHAKLEVLKGAHVFRIQTTDEMDRPNKPAKEWPFLCDSPDTPCTMNVAYGNYVAKTSGAQRFMCYVDDEHVGEGSFAVIVVPPRKGEDHHA